MSVTHLLSVLLTMLAMAYDSAGAAAASMTATVPAGPRPMAVIAQQVVTPSPVMTVKPISGAGSSTGSPPTPSPTPSPTSSPQSNGMLASLPVIAPIVSAFVVILASIITAFVTLRAADKSLQGVRQTLWQRANDEECKRLEKSLDEFYFPFRQRSEVSFLLAQDLRARLNDDHYRMLLALMKPGWKEGLPTGDQAIVKEVCENGKVLEKLIYEHAGVVDEPLLKYLGRASSHYRMLNLAYDGKLGTKTDEFKRYVFPEHLPNVLDMQVQLIQERCAYLRAHPDTPPPPMKKLEIPEKWTLGDWPDPPHAQLT
jgi:hypothetical protein